MICQELVDEKRAKMAAFLRKKEEDSDEEGDEDSFSMTCSIPSLAVS